MEKKVPNLNKIKEKYYNMLGKKRNKTNLFPYSYDKSNNINMNYTENNSNNKTNNRSTIDLSLNNLWINCINDVLSQSKENNENENNVEEVTLPCTFKTRDINVFTFAKSNNSINSNNKNRSKDSEIFIEINNNLPVDNDAAISNYKGIEADSQFSIKEGNPNN